MERYGTRKWEKLYLRRFSGSFQQIQVVSTRDSYMLIYSRWSWDKYVIEMQRDRKVAIYDVIHLFRKAFKNLFRIANKIIKCRELMLYYVLCNIFSFKKCKNRIWYFIFYTYARNLYERFYFQTFYFVTIYLIKIFLAKLFFNLCTRSCSKHFF